MAVLGLIVYLAFLSPNDSGPLSGIEFPPPDDEKPSQQPVSRGKGEPGPTGRPRLATTAPQANLIGALPPPSVTAVPPPDTPAGSQYSGTVARILGQVAAGRD